MNTCGAPAGAGERLFGGDASVILLPNEWHRFGSIRCELRLGDLAEQLGEFVGAHIGDCIVPLARQIEDVST